MREQDSIRSTVDDVVAVTLVDVREKGLAKTRQQRRFVEACALLPYTVCHSWLTSLWVLIAATNL
jgi:hypothetical protein